MEDRLPPIRELSLDEEPPRTSMEVHDMLIQAVSYVCQETNGARMCVEKQSLASFEGGIFSPEKGTFGVWEFNFSGKDMLAAEVFTTVTGALVGNTPRTWRTRGFDRLLGSSPPVFKADHMDTENECKSRSQLYALVPFQHTSHLFIRASVQVGDSESGTVGTIVTYFTLPVDRPERNAVPERFSVMDRKLDIPGSFRLDLQMHWQCFRSCSNYACSALVDYDTGPCPHCFKSWRCKAHASGMTTHVVECVNLSKTSPIIATETAKNLILHLGPDRNGDQWS
jgi:hypothetical protein